MSSETRYYCDICDNEILHKDLRRIAVKFIQNINYKELDICDECYKKATEFIYVESKDSEQKRFGSILKLWLGRVKNE